MSGPQSGVAPENGPARSSPASETEDDSAEARAVGREGELGDPFEWLANVEPGEYEFMRRRLARELGWRVSTLDRLYRHARRQARRR
jgi:hypothetical protein